MLFFKVIYTCYILKFLNSSNMWATDRWGIATVLCVISEEAQEHWTVLLAAPQWVQTGVAPALTAGAKGSVRGCKGLCVVEVGITRNSASIARLLRALWTLTVKGYREHPFQGRWTCSIRKNIKYRIRLHKRWGRREKSRQNRTSGQ